MHFYLLLYLLLPIGITIAEDTLVLVHAVVRHGHRTPEPMTSFPKDIHKNATFYPYGEGELNKIGIHGSFRVGKELRSRYDVFLGPKYYPKMLKAVSSGFTRCRMTMQLILAGLFPPHKTQTVEEGLSWQPIAFEYIERNVDLMISFQLCIKFMDTLPPNEEFSKCKDRDAIYKYLAENTGIDAMTLLMISYIRDTIRSELENGLSLPQWVERIWPEPLQMCAQDYWNSYCNNDTMLGTAGGLFIKKILDDTKETIEQNTIRDKTKLFLYTGHESSIYLLLGMLRNYNYTVVNYLAYVLLEVHKIDNVYGFKVYFNNHDEMGLRLLEIPKCGTFCPMDRFNEMMRPFANSKSCPL